MPPPFSEPQQQRRQRKLDISLSPEIERATMTAAEANEPVFLSVAPACMATVGPLCLDTLAYTLVGCVFLAALRCTAGCTVARHVARSQCQTMTHTAGILCTFLYCVWSFTVCACMCMCMCMSSLFCAHDLRCTFSVSLWQWSVIRLEPKRSEDDR